MTEAFFAPFAFWLEILGAVFSLPRADPDLRAPTPRRRSWERLIDMGAVLRARQ